MPITWASAGQYFARGASASGKPVAVSGEVSFLDLHTGLLGIHDEVRGKEMDIHFSVTRLPLVKDVHVGDSLDVSAVFDGKTYVAESIVANQVR